MGHAREWLTPTAPAKQLPARRVRYNITIPLKWNALFARVFWDIGRLLQYSLRDLGYSATLRDDYVDRDAVNILLYYQSVPRPQMLAGVRYIVYQLEQLTDSSDVRRGTRLRPEDFELMRGAEAVWEYSEVNRAYLRSKGIRARLLPFGYHERMRTITSERKDIDVLFYGAINARRKTFLTELARDCRLVVLREVY